MPSLTAAGGRPKAPRREALRLLAAPAAFSDGYAAAGGYRLYGCQRSTEVALLTDVVDLSVPFYESMPTENDLAPKFWDRMSHASAHRFYNNT